MRFCWVLLVLLRCRATLSASGPDDGSPSVLVPCPNVTGETLRFGLFRDGDQDRDRDRDRDQGPICSYTCEGGKCESQCGGSDARPHRDPEGGFLGFMVTATRSRVTYGCQGTVTFPPPLKRSLCGPVALLLVDGHQCGGEHGSDGALWVWMAAVAALAVYGLAATAMAAAFWIKVRRTDLQNDYMNTKPRAPPRKKRGIQTPLPRHF